MDLIRLDYPSPPPIQLHRALLSRRPRWKEGASIPAFEATLDGVRLGDAAEYARVCGFPTAEAARLVQPHILAAPLHFAIFTHPRMPVPAAGLVHARNLIAARRPLDPAEPLRVVVSCAGHRVARAGGEIDVLTRIEAGGEAAWEETTTALTRAIPGDRSPRAPEPEPLRALTRSTSWRLPADLGRRYAAVAGDSNPIHLYPWAAKLFGFPRAIIHGMWLLARCAAELEIAPPARLEIAFLRPALLPSSVFFSADAEGRFEVADAKGRRLVRGAYSVQI